MVFWQRSQNPRTQSPAQTGKIMRWIDLLLGPIHYSNACLPNCALSPSTSLSWKPWRQGPPMNGMPKPWLLQFFAVVITTMVFLLWPYFPFRCLFLRLFQRPLSPLRSETLGMTGRRYPSLTSAPILLRFFLGRLFFTPQFLWRALKSSMRRDLPLATC